MLKCPYFSIGFGYLHTDESPEVRILALNDSRLKIYCIQVMPPKEESDDEEDFENIPTLEELWASRPIQQV
jgi:hypothetical protein